MIKEVKNILSPEVNEDKAKFEANEKTHANAIIVFNHWINLGNSEEFARQKMMFYLNKNLI